MITAITIEGKELKRVDYDGDFDEFILQNTENNDIEMYAKYALDMHHEDDCDECDCPAPSISSFTDGDLMEEFKERGFITTKPSSIIEAQIIEQLIKSIKQ
jgi:hypothetical protein